MTTTEGKPTNVSPLDVGPRADAEEQAEQAEQGSRKAPPRGDQDPGIPACSPSVQTLGRHDVGRVLAAQGVRPPHPPRWRCRHSPGQPGHGGRSSACSLRVLSGVHDGYGQQEGCRRCGAALAA